MGLILFMSFWTLVKCCWITEATPWGKKGYEFCMRWLLLHDWNLILLLGSTWCSETEEFRKGFCFNCFNRVLISKRDTSKNHGQFQVRQNKIMECLHQCQLDSITSSRRYRSSVEEFRHAFECHLLWFLSHSNFDISVSHLGNIWTFVEAEILFPFSTWCCWKKLGIGSYAISNTFIWKTRQSTHCKFSSHDPYCSSLCFKFLL